MKNKMKFITAILALGLMMYGIIPLAFAQGGIATTSLTTAEGATLSFSPGGNFTLSGVTSTGASQTTTSSAVTHLLRDYRGSGAGWNIGFTTTSMGIQGDDIKITYASGSGSYKDATGLSAEYYGGGQATSTFSRDALVHAGEYVLVVNTRTSGGSVATADLVEPDGTTLTGVGTSNAACSGTDHAYGIAPRENMSFCLRGSRNFQSGDRLKFKVDAVPPSAFTIELTSLTGSGGNDSSGIATTATPRLAATALATISTSETLYSATTGAGMGFLNMAETVSAIVHGYPLSGNYQATFTYTINSGFASPG